MSTDGFTPEPEPGDLTSEPIEADLADDPTTDRPPSGRTYDDETPAADVDAIRDVEGRTRAVGPRRGGPHPAPRLTSDPRRSPPSVTTGSPGASTSDDRDMMSARRWAVPIVLVLVATLVVTQLARDGDGVVAVVVGAVLLVLAWFGSPARGRRDPTHEEALLRAANGEVVVYWRPGCPYCARLFGALRGRRGWLRVNIWRDPDAAAFVREHNGGDEVVPTVLVGRETWTNPEPSRVRAVLGSV